MEPLLYHCSCSAIAGCVTTTQPRIRHAATVSHSRRLKHNRPVHPSKQENATARNPQPVHGLAGERRSVFKKYYAITHPSQPTTSP